MHSLANACFQALDYGSLEQHQLVSDGSGAINEARVRKMQRRPKQKHVLTNTIRQVAGPIITGAAIFSRADLGESAEIPVTSLSAGREAGNSVFYIEAAPELPDRLHAAAD